MVAKLMVEISSLRIIFTNSWTELNFLMKVCSNNFDIQTVCEVRELTAILQHFFYLHDADVQGQMNCENGKLQLHLLITVNWKEYI